ncbi:MAG: YraN family protein [Chloroflexota bacterium]|nr:YraN family protein [Chloroflexota bacterium]
MGDARHDLGIAAEQAVAKWLVGAGWRILARRLRSAAGGEVDLIALDPTMVLVAIEVRARRSGRAGTGAETIDGRRTARIGRTLAAFSAASGHVHRGLRVDLVMVAPMPESVTAWRLRRIPDIGAW